MAQAQVKRAIVVPVKYGPRQGEYVQLQNHKKGYGPVNQRFIRVPRDTWRNEVYNPQDNAPAPARRRRQRRPKAAVPGPPPRPRHQFPPGTQTARKTQPRKAAPKHAPPRRRRASPEEVAAMDDAEYMNYINNHITRINRRRARSPEV